MQQLRWFMGLTALLLSTAFLADDPIYLDIYSRDGQDLAFGNARQEIRVDKRTGAWTSWTAKPALDNLLTPNSTHPAVDVSLNDNYLIAKYGATFLRKEITIDDDRRGSVLSVTVGILPQASGYAYELTQSYRLRPNQNRLERWARIVRNIPGPKAHFDGFRFQLPGVVIGPSGENTLTVPGPFFPKTFVAPNTPYDSLKAKSIPFHSAPDAGFGLILLTNKTRKTTLGSWMSTGGEVAYATAIEGNG